jgi:hypothetical protein
VNVIADILRINILLFELEVPEPDDIDFRIDALESEFDIGSRVGGAHYHNIVSQIVVAVVAQFDILEIEVGILVLVLVLVLALALVDNIVTIDMA